MPFLVSVVRQLRRRREPASARRTGRLPRHTVSVVGGCAAIIVLILLLAACGGDSSEPSIFGEGIVEIETQTGTVELDVEIAETMEARRLGLMGRASLPEDAGMVFLSPEPVANAFTMRNTLIPLSVAFIDGDGRILRVFDMEPCESETCPAYSPELLWSSALEVNQGAFDRYGVQPGDLVRLERS